MMTDRTPRNETTREKSSRRKPWAPLSGGCMHLNLQRGISTDGSVWQLVAKTTKSTSMPRSMKGGSLFEQMNIPKGTYRPSTMESMRGIIGAGGLVLARMPLETVKERNDYYRGRTREQMTAVDSDLMKEQHPSMPITNDRQTRVSFGGRNDSSNN